MALQIGESVGHYQIVEELGFGGHGRVLKVQHLITRRREAMKILANGRPHSQEYAHRVLREIRLQASLDHPNIAAVLNAFWLDDDLVMIMELVEGVTLQKVLEGRRLNLDQSIHWIRQVLLALAHAHANGVVHRDVSTANIIVSDDGRIKLTDFGLAKESADLSITESGGMAGSPYYVSPEQVRGMTATDQRSDIYSTGVVLYELLTGTKPFEAESSFLLMQAHVQANPQPPIARNAAIPQFISAAVLKAMAKNPLDRFQDAAEFLSAIDGPSELPMSIHETLSSPAAALPQALSHSYAAPVPAEDAVLPRKKSNPLRGIFSSPAMGAILGIGIVVASVAPVVFYDFESGRPRFGAKPEQMPAIQIPAPSVPDLKKTELTAGPKELLDSKQANGGAILRRNTAQKRGIARPANPALPPQVVVWGDAKTSPRVSALALPHKKMEEPPVLSSPQPKPAIQAEMPEVIPATPKKGIFRRFVNGVKALKMD